MGKGKEIHIHSINGRSRTDADRVTNLRLVRMPKKANLKTPKLSQPEYEDKLLRFTTAYMLTSVDSENVFIPAAEEPRTRDDVINWISNNFEDHWTKEEGMVLAKAMSKRMVKFTDDDDDDDDIDMDIFEQLLDRLKRRNTMSEAFPTAVKYMMEKVERKKREKLGLPPKEGYSLEKELKKLNVINAQRKRMGKDYLHSDSSSSDEEKEEGASDGREIWAEFVKKIKGKDDLQRIAEEEEGEVGQSHPHVDPSASVLDLRARPLDLSTSHQ